MEWEEKEEGKELRRRTKAAKRRGRDVRGLHRRRRKSGAIQLRCGQTLMIFDRYVSWSAHRLYLAVHTVSSFSFRTRVANTTLAPAAGAKVAKVRRWGEGEAYTSSNAIT